MGDTTLSSRFAPLVIPAGRRPIHIMLIGLPGSGKSTVRAAMLEAWRAPAPVVLSTDDFIDSRASDLGKTYSEVFSDTIDWATKDMVNAREWAVNLGQDIIQDQTNLSSKKRRGLLQCVGKEYFKIGIVVSCDEDERQARLLSRPGKLIPSHIDADMIARREAPTIEEGFDDIGTHFTWRALFSQHGVGVFPEQCGW